ncbi:MAG: DUF6141 family protein [Methanosarcinaceae archaeon]|nr:DUF6141 family protein [Methanosarcinaceae archaeon]MDD4331600.1 DUF6141 family protein [Methanosarcinaceae archaeon]MDD4749981.1 DUF6141 family protein [Methanosarcinaceae archaeon]
MRKSENDQLLFKEIQKVDSRWIKLFIFLPALFMWYITFQKLILKPTGNGPDWMLLFLLILVGLFLPIVSPKLRLITEVRESGIYIRFTPIHVEKYPFDTIIYYEIQTYYLDPIRNPYSVSIGEYLDFRLVNENSSFSSGSFLKNRYWNHSNGIQDLKYGYIYSACGNQGVFFEFDTRKIKKKIKGKGKRIMIGSQCPEKLAEAVQSGLNMQKQP